MIMLGRSIHAQWGQRPPRRQRSIAQEVAQVVRLATRQASPIRESRILRGRSIGCLPIVDKGQLMGIVTVSDLLEVVGRGRNRS